MSVGGSVGGCTAYATSEYKGEHQSESQTTIRMSQGQHGGPPEAVGMKLWKDGLIASNRTWLTIGHEMNVIYVWEIIKINHCGDFKNVEKISQLLSQAWEHLIHSSYSQKWQEHLRASPEAVKLMEKVKLWLSSKKESDCLQNLNTLLEEKQSLQKTDASDLWHEFYLNQTSIQCYLRWIVSIQQQNRTRNGAIQDVMQKVIEYTELVRIKNFHDRRYILEWLYPVSTSISYSTHDICKLKDLSSFLTFLQTVIEEYHYSNVLSSLKTFENAEITERLTVAVNMLCGLLSDTSHDRLLLVTILLPLEYDIQGHYFKNDLTVNHLTYLKNKLHECLETFTSLKEDALSSQVYLFLQALQTDGPVDRNVTESMLTTHIQYLQSKIENLDTSVKLALTKSQQSSNRYNFRQLKELLNEINVKQSQPQDEDINKSEYIICEAPLPSSTTKPPKDKKYEDFLDAVKFLEYFPQKLTLQEALSIDCYMDNYTETSDLENLLWVILQKIKMSNYNSRNVTNKVAGADSGDKTAYDPFENEYDPFESVDHFEMSNNDSNTNDNTKEPLANSYGDVFSYDTTQIHPMDSLIALLHCSDNFLKQFLIQKLITAQLAIPLLAPDPVTGDLEVPLWSLRSIVKYWKSKEEQFSQEARIIDLDIPLISFMRFSHPETYSKSALLNKLISQSSTYNFFFNIDCNGSSAERKFVNGIVEACWYLPSGKESDHFNDVITFANLRGNAGICSKQFAFLSYHSYMSYIFLAEEDIQMYSESIEKLNSVQGNVIFLMKTCSKDNERVLKKLVQKCHTIHLTLRNEQRVKQPADVAKEIRSLIKMRLSKQKSPVCKLSACCEPSQIKALGICTDEEKSEPCKNGKEFAEKIMEEVRSYSPEEVKEKIVPLQSPSLWHKWASLDKKENRMKSEEMGEDGMEQFKKKKRDEKNEIRKKQLDKIQKQNRSKVISIFIDVLCNQKQEVRTYFLIWLKFFLDDNSRKVLPRFQRQCKDTRAKLRNKGLSPNEKEKIRKDLQKYDQELIHASFGVEHLFREIGQMYECVMELQTYSVDKALIKEARTLRNVASHLLVSGYPMEIVDGDAAHIPLKWVSDILSVVNKLKATSKIAVLSVLGIQSTGKSTLLNTVYGAQFAVSAGRCTRGAYCQLLKVMSSQSECDCMLIIDTEGLRAPELDSQQTQQHDNELATLVIGLAGATIVNISGEVPADINDILQTSVHAFLRMKNVELKPSCQFVRHHVVDAAAGKSNEGSQRFQQTLDEMTILAAKAERCAGQFQFFNEVIAFNNEKDIQNFAGLWEGNPPMAPVNPAYCEDAVKLKSKIFQFFVSPDTLCSIIEFDLRLSKLWESVLGENFLFSFKNTLEVEAYAKLDAEYGTKWSWRLQNLMLQWQGETRKCIASTGTDDVESIKTSQLHKIETDLDKEYNSILIDFKKFFEMNPNSSLAARMAQWRALYKKKLDNLRDDHKSSAPRFCQELINKKLAKKKFENMQKNERDRINKLLKKLVAEMDMDKDRELTDDDFLEIETKFNLAWDKWMAKLKREHPQNLKADIEQEILHSIKQRCGLEKEDPVINREVKHCAIRDRGNPLQLILDQEKHINFESFLSFKYISGAIKGEFRADKVKSAERFTNKILLEAKSDLDQYELYSDNIINIVVQAIKRKITDFEEENKIEFTTLYLVEIVLEVSGYAFRVFEGLQNEAIENHPVTYLTSLRPSYETTFKALCTATAQEKASALCLLDLVFKQVQPALVEKITLQIANDVMCNNSIFESKTVLKGQVLLKLLKEGDYQLYDDYLQNIRKSYLHWIREYVDEHCKKNTSGKLKVVSLANWELSKIVAKVVTAAETASGGTPTEISPKQWITAFHTYLVGELSLNEQELHDIIQLQPDSDLEFFKNEFINGVRQKEKEYSKSFEQSEQSEELKLKTLIDRAGVIVRDNIAGCCEQCPFCKEQCERTDVKHEGDHFCSLHRPQCLGGYRDSESRKMDLTICTVDIGGDRSFRCSATNNEFVPYKKYRDIYPHWNIANETRTSAPYWKWFTNKYKDQIVESFGFKPVSLSSDWTNLTHSDAESDIRKRYDLK